MLHPHSSRLHRVAGPIPRHLCCPPPTTVTRTSRRSISGRPPPSMTSGLAPTPSAELLAGPAANVYLHIREDLESITTTTAGTALSRTGSGKHFDPRAGDIRKFSVTTSMTLSRSRRSSTVVYQAVPNDALVASHGPFSVHPPPLLHEESRPPHFRQPPLQLPNQQLQGSPHSLQNHGSFSYRPYDDSIIVSSHAPQAQPPPPFEHLPPSSAMAVDFRPRQQVLVPVHHPGMPEGLGMIADGRLADDDIDGVSPGFALEHQQSLVGHIEQDLVDDGLNVRWDDINPAPGADEEEQAFDLSEHLP